VETDWIEDAERAAAGEKEAFVRLMMRMEGTLYRVARSILKTENECFDAVQEAVLNAYHSVQALREPRYFQTWMIRILINVCYRIIREKSKVVPLLDPQREETSSRFEQQVELKVALESLEEDLRLPLELHYFEGFTVREIAEILQVAEGTIKSRLVKARAKLAKWYTRAEGKRGWVKV
jgi:RNA polymerase sigma factor (sigma-70 family)